MNSILEQDYRPIEIIIVDDGSTDNTREIIESICLSTPGVIVPVHQNNQGAGKARQAGLEQAQGEFIQYLDSDDTILPGKFSVQVKLLSSNPDCSMALGLTRGIPMNTGAGKSAEGSLEHSDYLYPSILNYRWWTTSTPLYRSEAAHYAHWADATVLEDWDYEFQIAARGVKYCFNPVYVVDKSDDADDQLSQYKTSKRELWLESKARVMTNIASQIREFDLDRRNENFTRFINKIIKTGEEALEYSRADISKQMAALAVRSMKQNLRLNFIKRIMILHAHILLPGKKKN